MKSSSFLSLLVLVVLLLAASCEPGNAAYPAAEVDHEVEPAEKPILKFYNWDTYIDPQIIEDFENRFDVAVDYLVYDSDTDMVEELRAGGTDYDLVVPSDFNVTVLRNEGLLLPLDKENIPNTANIAPVFISPVFDPANRYCVPYQWGSVGIGYNISGTGREITSWEDFFDPAFAGRVAVLDDYRTTMGVVSLYLGYSPNTTNPGEIEEVAQFINEQAAQIGGYLGDDAQDLLVAGKYDMVIEWSGDIYQVMEEHEEIRYVIPREGSIVWTDNICIPDGARHKELAEQFINYLLDPQVGAALSNYIQYASPNQAALQYIDPALLGDPAVYPPAEVQERLFFQVDVDLAANAIYEEAWAGILARDDS